MIEETDIYQLVGTIILILVEVVSCTIADVLALLG